MINIEGLDKAKVLHALWHASHAQGLSFMGFTGGFPLERAQELIKERDDNRREKDPYRLYFDYVDGHIVKCNLTGDEFDERLFDRDCGEGAAAKAIENLRNGIIPEPKSQMDIDRDALAAIFGMAAAEENKRKEKNE